MKLPELQRLFFTSEYSPGSAFFTPKGTRIVAKLTAFMRQQLRRHGFSEVITPQIFRNELWQKSGHWDHYQENMFGVSGLSMPYSLKPMNCPAHCLLYKSEPRSFRQLPIRYADFSPLHRNESSGALSGLTRVRRFHQDDGHVFCRPDQVFSEIETNLELIHSVYSTFGLPYTRSLSTRPSEYLGAVETWDEAEKQLQTALGANYSVKHGDGAFYGPKIDIQIQDSLGKQHQAATLQLDFQLPRLFELEYSDKDMQLKQPVIIHRAVFGSIERFLALLIEHYQGTWPFWLNPTQAIVIPVSEKHVEYAYKVREQLNPASTAASPVSLNASWFNIDVFDQNSALKKRVHAAVQTRPNYILVVGDAEMETNTVSVRKDNKPVSMHVGALHAEFLTREASYT